jgi:predicted permease
VASLAVGLGAGLAIFTFMNALLYRPLPGHGTADLQKVFTSDRSGKLYGSSSYADFRDFAETTGLFTATCATTRTQANLVADGQTHALKGAIVSGGCFGALGLRPHLGHLLGPADEADFGGPVPIVISHGLWRTGFAESPGIVGRNVLLNGASAVVVGVSEIGFAGLSLDAGATFFAPARTAPRLVSPTVLTSRGYRTFAVFARLAEGVSASQAMDRLALVAAQLRAEHPSAWTDESGSTRKVTVMPELEARFASGGDGSLLALAFVGAIAAIVALACVNLATMLVARGAARTRELAIRLSLGASRVRLLRQLATESLLISIGGMVVGAAVVVTTIKLFEAYRPIGIPAFNIGLDWRVVAAALLMAILAPLVFGVAPGAHALRLAIAEGLKNRQVARQSRILRAGPREVLIVVQVAVAFALLVGATLFMQSLRSAQPIVGAAAERLTIVNVDLSAAAAANGSAGDLSRRLLMAAERVPAARVAVAGLIPMTGSYMTTLGRAAEAPPQQTEPLDVNVVSRGYFDLIGTAVRHGRDFRASDVSGAPLVAVVSESMARKLWQSTAVLGRSIWLNDRLHDVVGVVADMPYRQTTASSHPVVYVPMLQSPRERFVVHAQVSGQDGMAALGRELRGVDARVLVSAPATLASQYEQVRLPAKIVELVGGVAGTLQLALALMATWGLVAYAVERRSAEIAIRRALGATESGILRLVMRPSLWLFASGGAAGCAAGAAMAKAMHAEFLGLGPIDLRAVLPAAALLGAVVVCAAWIPARRATAIQPASLLRTPIA